MLNTSWQLMQEEECHGAIKPALMEIVLKPEH